MEQIDPTITATPQFPKTTQLERAVTQRDTLQAQGEEDILALIQEIRESGPLGAAFIDAMEETVSRAAEAGLNPNNQHHRKMVETLGDQILIKHLILARAGSASGPKGGPDDQQ